MSETHNPTAALASGRNPVGIRGLGFIEYASPDPGALDMLFRDMGFSRLHGHQSARVAHYQQNGIHFLLNRESNSFAADFTAQHGPSVCAMGWLVDSAEAAVDAAVAGGARRYRGPAVYGDVPAVYGVGDSLIYFVEDVATFVGQQFQPLDEQMLVPDNGFTHIDHLTNNVYKGTMEQWRRFYIDVFGFSDVRSFDIDGQSTGLVSYALRSPDGSFCIPINEAKDDKSQIAEYLREYNGAGIQHIALTSPDLLRSLGRMENTPIETLDIDDAYYDECWSRAPTFAGDKEEVKRLRALVDGDEEGYLLQIFTKNVIGPVFFEMIERANHWSFGEGNFGALFRSIEIDQERRGVL